MTFKIYKGSNFFRQRLVLSLLSGKPIKITNIRDSSDEPGINGAEESFLSLLDIVTDGSTIIVNETGTSVSFSPGLLLGGKLQHNCNIQMCIGYYLEPLLCLAPFCKKPLQITLRGITNDDLGPSVDAIKASSLPLLKRFIIKDENLDLKIVSRGMPPEGGGEIVFSSPVINNIRPVKFLDAGKIKRFRGTAYSARVSPAMSSRMVDAAKGLLLNCLPDVYIYTDHYKGKNAGKSPGYGITLVAETTNGVFYTAEAVSEPSGSEKEFKTPEDVAKNAVYDLYEEIYRGGCVDSRNQGLALLLMTLGTVDVSKIKIGPLSPYSKAFINNIDDFLQVRMKLEVNEEKLKTGSKKIIVTCVGTGYTNISRMVQ